LLFWPSTAPARRTQQAHDDANGSRLASTVEPQQSSDLAGLHLQVQIANNGALAEVSRQPVCSNNGIQHGCLRMFSGSVYFV
jgi:hypothetical protein